MEGLLTLLPFGLLILICPLMMLFMHRGGHSNRAPRRPNVSKDEVRR